MSFTLDLAFDFKVCQLLDVYFRGLPFPGLISGYLIECMYGDEYYIAVLISKFHNLLHPSHIVPHTDKTTENAHSVVYMHNIIPYIESIKVIEGELFALVHRTP